MNGKTGAALAGLVFLLALAGIVYWSSRPAAAPPVAAALDTASPAAAGEIPVIIYLIDTLRADRLSLYGYDRPTSPRIDALEKESVVFEHAYSAAPWTLPSATSLFTSRYSCEHGMVRNHLALSPALPTLAEHMQELGYSTASYFQNTFVGPVTGLARGFQVQEYRHDLETLDVDTKDFLKKAGSQPFFLYLHSMEPHATYFTPPEEIRKLGHVSIDDREAYRAHWVTYKMFWYSDSRNRKPIGSTDTTGGIDQALGNLDRIKGSANTLYDSAVRFADTELGQTIDVLKQTGVWDRALFILLADHGEELQDHGLWFHDQSVYEELTHVPLVVHFPKGQFGGQRVSERVSLLDVMPTVLDFLGHKDVCEGCRGSSLLPLVEPGRGAYTGVDVPSLRINVWGYYKPLKRAKGDINVVVRDGSLKGIWNKEVDKLELYDLSADGGEHRDIAANKPAEAKALKKQATEWYAQCEAQQVAPTEVPEEEIDESHRERLEAHGYFGG